MPQLQWSQNGVGCGAWRHYGRVRGAAQAADRPVTPALDLRVHFLRGRELQEHLWAEKAEAPILGSLKPGVGVFEGF